MNRWACIQTQIPANTGTLKNDIFVTSHIIWHLCFKGLKKYFIKSYDYYFWLIYCKYILWTHSHPPPHFMFLKVNLLRRYLLKFLPPLLCKMIMQFSYNNCMICSQWKWLRGVDYWYISRNLVSLPSSTRLSDCLVGYQLLSMCTHPLW